ncbi:MAG: hypothetical protein FJZ47_04645, partial [Candidatus Tectomicrobia bacterium]|nr:hypothetical protein [Candidatus Tectomicrobia bacterium]
PPAVVDSDPRDGATAVRVDQTLSVRFSTPLAVTSLNTETVVLFGPDGQVPVRVTPAADGLLVSALPEQALRPGAHYALLVQGAMDARHQTLAWVAIRFTTQTLGPPHAAVAMGAASLPATATDDGEAWLPGPEQWQGHWRTSRPLPEAVMALLKHAALGRKARTSTSAHPVVASPEHLLAAPAVTGIGGTVLKLTDVPLAHVAVTIGSRTVRTDVQGRFELTSIPPGQHEISVDGRTVPGGREYLHVIFKVEVREQGLTELPHAVYLPQVRAMDWISVSSPTTADTVIRHPAWPEVEVLHVPRDTVFRDRQGTILTRFALVPVPLDRAPYPTPAAFPMYFLLHPGGILVDGTSTRGMQTVYPNVLQQPPGTEHVLWSYDPQGDGWRVYGKGYVSQQGSYVEPEAGADLHAHMGAGHSLPPGAPPPLIAPVPECPCFAGDPVDCTTGLFFHTRTDIVLDDVLPLVFARTYRPDDSTLRAFGKGANHNYGIYLRNPHVGSRERVELILADGSRVLLPRIGGTDLHTDFVWRHTATPSRFYGAELTAPRLSDVGEVWDLRLKDGTRYVFGSPSGLLEQVIDRNGNSLFFTYNGGRLLQITTTHGRYVQLQYDVFGRITDITDFTGRTWRYQYTPAGSLVLATYPDLSSETYTYDSPDFPGGMDTVRDRRGHLMVRNTYDTNGRVIRQTLADGGVYHFAYTLDADGHIRQTEVTNPRGQVLRREFNAAGFLTRQTRGLGLSIAQVETYTRNASHFVTTSTDPLGRVTSYAYDAVGNVTRLTLLAGTPDATTWRYAYEPLYNQLRSITDPLGHITTLSYDSEGNLLQLRDPLGHRATFTYDPLGRPLTASQHVGSTPLTATFTYDGPDLVRLKDPLGRVVTLTPDLLGRTLAVRDPLGRLSRFTYDALDRVVTQVDPQGRTLRYTYDSHGNLLTFTDANHHVTTFTYDPRNRLVSKTDALLKMESYRYDAAGNLTFLTDRKGQVAGFSYDALNRLAKASYGAASTTAPVYTSSTRYSYDQGDRLLKLQDSLAGTITRTYDPRFDTVTQETTPEGTVTYTYDAHGLRTTMLPTGGTPISYSYDAANRLVSLTQAAGAGGGAVPGTVQTVSVGYDTANRQTSLTLPNGIHVTYTYDAASQLTSITYKKADATVLGDLTYTYDANGQRIAMGGSLADSDLPQPFGLARYDANNRLIKLDKVSYTYDDNGNMLSDGVNTYTWNARNQLVAIRGAHTATYTYDGFGRRRKGLTTSTLYDGWNPIQLKHGAIVVENRLTGLRLDAYYARVRDGVVQSYLTDALGSTMQLRDQAQRVVADYVYDPYGGAATSVDTNLVRYTGREQDFADVYYYRNRYYKPSIGRFLSEDPLGLAGRDANLYRYTANDPANRVDPLGLEDIVIFRTNEYGVHDIYGITDPDSGTRLFFDFVPNAAGDVDRVFHYVPGTFQYRGTQLPPNIQQTIVGKINLPPEAARQVIRAFREAIASPAQPSFNVCLANCRARPAQLINRALGLSLIRYDPIEGAIGKFFPQTNLTGYHFFMPSPHIIAPIVIRRLIGTN